MSGVEVDLFGEQWHKYTANRARFVPAPPIRGTTTSGHRLPLPLLRAGEAYIQAVQLLPPDGRADTGGLHQEAFDGGRHARTARMGAPRAGIRGRRSYASTCRWCLAMAKRTRLVSIDFNDLVSEGNLALLRSIEKYDCARGFKFSTYACRAILKSFSRVAMRMSRYRGRFPTELDPSMEKSTFVETKRGLVEQDCVDELKEILIKNLAKLSDVESTVIKERFAIGQAVDNGSRKAKTLEQVGTIIGVTKERVRQIQTQGVEENPRCSGRALPGCVKQNSLILLLHERGEPVGSSDRPLTVA